MVFRSNAKAPEKDFIYLSSCCLGEVIPLENLKDNAFSSLILGDGFGVIPSEETIVSPVNGVVKDISSDRCNITIKSSDGLILLISLINSSSESEIVPFVSVGDSINSGTKLFELNSYNPDNSENSLYAAVVVTNIDLFNTFNLSYGEIKTITQPVMTISL